MDISRVNLIYFSPTGGTKKVGEYVAQNIRADKELIFSDITVNSAEITGKSFSFNELAVFCFPVYGGRVPQPATERLMSVTANGTPAVIIAVYGNRAYDDALLETKNIVEALGFKTIAAGAFIAEHSVIRSFGKSRPDKEDIKAERAFSKAVIKKLNETSAEKILSIQVPGNATYRKYNGIPLKPHAGPKCIRCGLCSQNCPAGAICADNPRKTDKTKCISCMRCINICPESSRKLNPFLELLAKVVMKKYCSTRKEPEIFI